MRRENSAKFRRFFLVKYTFNFYYFYAFFYRSCSRKVARRFFAVYQVAKLTLNALMASQNERSIF